MPSPSYSNTEPGGPPLALPGQEAQRIPDHIGEFRILALISSGMALVYKAEQPSPQRLVALKIPRGGKLLSSESRDRFLREVRLASSLDHAGIVPVLDTGEVDGTPYYTMPFIEGLPLDQHVQKAGLTLTERLQLFHRLCSVVQALHEKDLIHRDLKPANVLVDRYGDVRLLDFGLARALEESTAISMDHSLMGTLQYMAPEQTLPDAARVTTATDVYSLGVVLYWLVTDAYPCPVEGPREAVLSTIRTAPVPVPSSLRPGEGNAYDGVILRALEKEPSRRFQTAGELATALRAAESGRVSQPEQTSVSTGWRTIDFIILGLAVGLLIFLAVVLIREFKGPPDGPLKRPVRNLSEQIQRR